MNTPPPPPSLLSPPPIARKASGTRTGVETPVNPSITDHQLQFTPPPPSSYASNTGTGNVARELQFGGNKTEKVQYKGGSYKVRTGPKGGKYILVKQEKVYLKK